MQANNTVGLTGITLACNTPILEQPLSNSYVQVLINGILIPNGIGKPCFFSSDFGITEKESNNVAINDSLYWNKSLEPYKLDNTDIIDFNYLIGINSSSTLPLDNSFKFITNTITINETFFNSPSVITLLECPNSNNFLQIDNLFLDFTNLTSLSYKNPVLFIKYDNNSNYNIGYNDKITLPNKIYNNQKFNNIVNTFSFDNNKLYCGGNFTQYTGQTSNRLISLNLDGTINTGITIGNGFNNDIYSTLIDNNKLYCGGNFTNYSGQTSNRIICLNLDGTIDNSFNIGLGFNNDVNSIIIDNNKLYCGGNFTQYSGLTNNCIVSLNLDGTINTGFTISNGFNNSINSMIIHDNKLYCGGNFTTYSGQTSNRLIRLNLDGTIDNSFNIGLGFNNLVKTLYIDTINSKLYYGGDFTTYSGQTSNRLIRLNLDGSIDKTYNGFNDSINTIDFYNSKLYCGGSFSEYSGKTINNIISLNLDGSINNVFNITNEFDTTSVKYLKINSDKIYISDDVNRLNVYDLFGNKTNFSVINTITNNNILINNNSSETFLNSNIKPINIDGSNLKKN